MRFILRLLITALTIFAVAYLSEGRLVAWTPSGRRRSSRRWCSASSTRSSSPSSSCSRCRSPASRSALFLLVINAAMLYLVDWIVPGFETVGFLPTVLAAILIAIVGGIGGKLIDDDKRGDPD